MKRVCLLLFALFLPFLSACGSLRGGYPKLEQLRVIQTLGVDSSGSGVRLSLATAAGDRSGNDAICLSADGPSISAALSRAESLSTEETLFCGHIQQLVMGEGVALEPLLNYIGRSADLRLDMPLYLLRGATAEEVMDGAGSGSRGITEVLNAVQAELDYRSRSRDYTAGQILQDLRQQGSALLCVLNYSDAAEDGSSAVDGGGTENGTDSVDVTGAADGESAGGEESGAQEGPKTAALAGLAVVKDGGISAYLQPEDLLGVCLLRNSLGIQELTLKDKNGAAAALEIRQGSSRLKPVWRDDGSLQGLDITVKLTASLLEAEASPLSDPYIDDLTARLEAAVSEQLRSLLTRSKNLQADFLGLGARVEKAAPLAFRRLETPFPELLGQLEISLAVQSTIQHEYDMS